MAFAIVLLALPMTTDALKWTCTNRDGRVWKLDPTRSMDTQDEGELPDGYYVPLTGIREVVDIYGGDFRAFFNNPPELSPTGYYAEYPYPEIDPNCQVILHTNKLAASDCPLPHSCGPASFTEIDSSWWGDEHGLCSTAGAHHHSVTPDSVPNDPGWAQIMTLRVGINDDLCNAAEHFNVLQFPNGSRYVVPRIALSNRPVFNIGTGTYTALYLKLDRRIGKDSRCVVKPTNIWAIPYDTWKPPFLARRRKNSYTGIRFTPLSDVNLTTVIIRGDWGDNLRPILFHSPPDEPVECLDIRYVTKYDVPGSTIIPSVLDHVLDFLLKILGMVVTGIVPFFTKIVTELDQQYRVLEIFTVLMLALWWTDRPQHALVAASVYALATGLRR